MIDGTFIEKNLLEPMIDSQVYHIHKLATML
jgi:hypothetical protein